MPTTAITVKPVTTLYGAGHAVMQGEKTLSIHLGPQSEGRAKLDAKFWRKIGLEANR